MKRRWLRRAAIVVGVLVLLEILLRVGGALYLSHLYVRDLSPGNIRVLCLGESSTQGLGVPRADSYPAQLRALLGARYHREFSLIVPPHVGQNTSQVADRVDEYMREYRPDLVIIMVGINNEWALRDSHIGRFLTGADARSWWVKAQIALDGVRLFRVARYLYLRIASHGDGDWAQGEKLAALGDPGYVQYPPPREVYSFAVRNRDAFNALFHADVEQIIAAVRRGGAQPLLMTYHIPGWLPVEEYIAMATQTHTPLVRNDLAFAPLVKNGTIGDYVLADHWHPNKQGYAIIARDALDVITSLDLLTLADPQRAP